MVLAVPLETPLHRADKQLVATPRLRVHKLMKV
jgi:hypothetical protein